MCTTGVRLDGAPLRLQLVMPHMSYLPKGVQFTFFDTSGNENGFKLLRSTEGSDARQLITRSEGPLVGCGNMFSNQEFSDYSSSEHPGVEMTYCVASQLETVEPPAGGRKDDCITAKMFWFSILDLAVTTRARLFPVKQ